LDLGGGAGEFARIARDRGYEVTLVDGDPRNIANLAGSGIQGVLADLDAPLENLPVDGFDGVSLIEVIEHIPHAERLIAEAHRLLKPGGLLLLSTPNAVWWRERLRILAGRMPEAEGYHYRFFNVRHVRKLLETAGFEVVRMEFSSPAFGLNWLGRHVLERPTRRHIRIPAVVAGLLAQTIFVIGRKP
jgi:SAM-dependent methyltransferase